MAAGTSSVSSSTEDRMRILLEIKKLADENLIPILIFPDFDEMKIFIEDTKLGAQIRYSLKQLNIPLAKDWMQ